MLGKFIAHIGVAILIIAGCAPEARRPRQLYPAAESADEVLSILRLRSQNAAPLKANGRCLLQYYAEGKKKPEKESFPVKLWLSPPRQVYLQGDVAFDPKGIVLGSNEDEFWLAIKLKEISSYWWGEWSEESCFEKLMIDPKLILEAFGIAAVDGEKEGEGDWSLSNEGAFDVLTKREADRQTQKIYVSNYDYLVSKIGYLDSNGKALVVIELGKYEGVSKDFFVPTIVRIIKHEAENRENPVNITLKLSSIKSKDFTGKQKERLFTRPEPRGFKHIYKIIENCDMIEQP